MLVELVLCPVTFTGAAVGSDKKVHKTGLEISQGTVWRICIQMLGCKTFITNKTFRKKKYLLSWSVLTTIGLLSGPSPFEVDARTVMS